MHRLVAPAVLAGLLSCSGSATLEEVPVNGGTTTPTWGGGYGTQSSLATDFGDLLGELGAVTHEDIGSW